jgi:Cu-Zn family superoxide dismutase
MQAKENSMRNRTWLASVAVVAVVAVAVQFQIAQSQQVKAKGTRKKSAAAAEHTRMANKVTYAIAVVDGLGDHKAKGKVTFTQTDDGVEIVGEFTGLQPGKHGFHVHEFGDCSMADGKCAGAHFNPEGAPHAGPEDAKRHVGDLGNLEADGQGHASYKRTDKLIALNGPHSIIGRSLIVHAKADDLKSQPSGDAGDRIGCGVIGIGDPKMMMH